MAVKNTYVAGRLASIEVALKKADAFKSDPQVASYLAGFLAVMISGVYEDCVEHLVCERVKRASDIEIHHYFEKDISESFRNPEFGKVQGILGEFSKNWADDIKKKVDYPSQQALDSIVADKNAIAHGKSSTLTVSDIKNYHRRCKSIFVVLEGILK